MAYIGKSPTGSAVRQRYHFTATGGETSLSGADDNSKTLKFTDGEYVDVYLNGILLVQGTDYGVGTANTISSLAALSANDIVEVVVYDIYNVAKINSEAVRARHYYTATGGETSIGTSEIAGLSFAANAEIDVSLNGISLVAGTDYNTTSANTVGGLSALSAGNVIEIVIYEKFQLADMLSKSAGGTVSGNVAIGGTLSVTGAATASGGLNVGTIKEATGTTTAISIDSSGNIDINGNDLILDADGDTKISASTDDVMTFDTAASERIRIDSSGNLQLGYGGQTTTAFSAPQGITIGSLDNVALQYYIRKGNQAEAHIGYKSSTDTNFYVGTGGGPGPGGIGFYGVYMSNLANSWSSISDETKKTIVGNIENASEKVSTLRTVMGYYNNDENETHKPFLIAQDVQAVLPEAVSVADVETGILGLSYTDVIPLLTAAIKEQRETITALEDRIAALETA